MPKFIFSSNITPTCIFLADGVGGIFDSPISMGLAATLSEFRDDTTSWYSVLSSFNFSLWYAIHSLISARHGDVLIPYQPHHRWWKWCKAECHQRKVDMTHHVAGRWHQLGQYIKWTIQGPTPTLEPLRILKIHFLMLCPGYILIGFGPLNRIETNRGYSLY